MGPTPVNQFSPLLAATITTLLFVLSWPNERGKATGRVLLALLAGMDLFCIAVFLMRMSAEIGSALRWERYVAVFGLSIFVFFYHFSALTAGTTRLVPLAYVYFAATGALTMFTRLVVVSMRVTAYGYSPNIGSLGMLLFLGVPVLTALAMLNLAVAYRRTENYEIRKRLVYLALAGLFPPLGIALDAFTTLPPAAIWSNVVFCSLVTIASVRYRLIDIRVIARRGAGYLLVSALTGLPFGLFIVLGSLSAQRAWQEPWVYAATIVGLAVLLRPIYSRAQTVVDRLFYRDRNERLRALEQLSATALAAVDPEEQTRNLTITIAQLVGTESVSLLQPDAEGGGYQVSATTDQGETKLGEAFLGDDSALAEWLGQHQSLLRVDQLDMNPQLQSLSAGERNRLEKIGGRLFVPLVVRDVLVGILVLGPKRSGRPYTDEDSIVLESIRYQVATLLDNLRLYREAVRTRAQLETWLNSMTDCVLIVGPQGRIRFLNTAARARFEVEPGHESVVPDPGDQTRDEARRYVTEIGGREYEIACAPLSDAAGQTLQIYVMRDMSERKELEERSRLSSRLAAVGQMASGVAHEINNPLTAVLGYSDLILNSDVPEVTRSHYLQLIRAGAERVAAIVRRLLMFARQQKPQRQLANVNDLIAQSLELRAYDLRTSGIKVTTALDGAVPSTVMDSLQIQQLFLNLIGNAEAAMKEAHDGGQLHIESQVTSDTIVISFRDDGPGIPVEIQEKIFEPFFTTKAVGKGTGLGLGICHAVATGHGGRLEVHSVPGAGAEFVATLPITGELAAPTEEHPIPAKPDRTGRILVVDDEPAIRSYLRDLLELDGNTVELAETGEDALEKVKNGRFHAILMDVRMPDMSGIELCDRLRDLAESIVERVVLMTGDVMSEEIQRLGKERKIPVLPKPLDVQQLRAALRGILVGGG